jgi:hypothetical protein
MTLNYSKLKEARDNLDYQKALKDLGIQDLNKTGGKTK